MAKSMFRTLILFICISQIYFTIEADAGLTDNLSSSSFKKSTEKEVILDEVTFDSGDSMVITQISPNMGDQSGGTQVTIEGNNFPSNPRVFIDEVECKVFSSNNLLIQCSTGQQKHFVEPSIQIKSEQNELLLKTTDHPFYYYQRWSDKTTWEEDIPKNDEDVVIIKNQVVLVDVPKLMIGILKIQGVLIFEDLDNMEINLEGIILDGGKIIIGSKNVPHVNDLVFNLRGDEREGTDFLGNVLCIDCEMDIHGKDRKGSLLSKNAFIGDTSIEVQNSSNFLKNSEIEIIGISKKVSEKVFISEISGNTLKIKQPLKNRYLVENKLSNQKVKVEFLTENIKFRKSQNLNEDEKDPMIIIKERNLRPNLKFSNFNIKTITEKATLENLYSPMSTRKIVKTALRSRPRILTIEGSTRNWSTTGHWPGSTLPVAGDSVTITSTWNMILDQSTPILNKLTIEGRLTFDPSGSGLELKAKVIEIKAGGELIIGSEAIRYANGAKIILHGVTGDTAVATATGLPSIKNGIINKGLIKIYGDKSRFVTSKLIEDVVATNTVLKLDNDVHGWQAGDELIIPSSMVDGSKVELGTIASVSGNEITLNAGLAYKHKAYLDFSVDSRTIPVGTEIVNLTKKVVIESYDSSFGCVLINPGYTSPTTTNGEFHIEDVEFKGCGQDANDIYAIHLEGTGSPANYSVLKRCSLNSVLGRGIGVKNAKNLRVQESVIYSFMHSGVELLMASDVDFDNNRIIKSTTTKYPNTGAAVEFNYAFFYGNPLQTLEQTNTFIRNNRVSSISTTGIAFMVPGADCANNFSDVTLYHFQGNVAHSSDVGWASLRNFPSSSPAECQKFSHFKAFKIRLLAVAYFGTTPQTIFEEIVVSDSQYSMMNVIEPHPTSAKEQKVTIRNSAFVGRTFPNDTDIYQGRYDCETNGITTPMFSSAPLASNPLWAGVNLATYITTNLPGKEYFENVTFRNFKPDGNCSLVSYSLRMNDAYQNSPISLYMSNVKFEEVDQSNQLDFPDQTRHPTASLYCGSNDCNGLSNSVIFDSDGSFANDGIPRIYYGDNQNLDADTNCQKDDTYTNTFRCVAIYGQIFFEGSTLADGDLFPLIISSNSSLTGGTVVPFSNTINAGVSGGGQLLLREVNTVAFNNTLTKNITVTMTAANVLDWVILRIDAGARNTIDVFKAGTKIDRYTSETIDVPSLMLFAGVCGKNIFDRSTNSLYLMMNGTEDCSVELRPVSGLASSLKLTTSNPDFFSNDGVTKIRNYLYTASGLASSTNRINIGMVRPGSTIVEFEIEESGTVSGADPNVDNLETTYCAINTYLLANQTIDSFTSADGLGMATVLVTGATKDYYLPSCNTQPHDKVACTQWSDDTTECVTCGRGFAKNATTKICEPTNCAVPNTTTGQCTTCNTGYYLDASFYNTCVAVTSVTQCATYQPTQDQCATCNTGFFLNGNSCDPSTNVPECIQYSANGVCSLCNNTFGTSGGSCINGTVDNCLTFAASDTCTVCDNGFYLSSPSSCLPYTSDLNCKTFNPTADQCIDCNTGARLVTSKFCEANTSCEGLDFNGVDCKICASGFYLDSTHTVCRARTATNCATTQPNADQCATCLTLHWMDASDSNKCKPVTSVDNCFEYETNQDQCKTCDAGRELTGNTCPYKVIVIDNCATYQTFGICATCDANHYLFNNECNPISIAGCTTQTSPTTCTACDSSNFLNGTTCSVYTVQNCKTFKIDANECVDCPDYYLFNSTDKTCTEIVSCDTFASNKVDCSVCKNGFVMNTTTKQCDARTALNCKTVLPTVDQCDQCNDNAYKDTSDSNKCKLTTVVTNCQEYETTSDACKSCIAGYYLDTTCKPAPTSIDNCKTYTSATTCTACNDGYYLKDNKCPKGEMVGCLVYTGETTCSSCETGFFLVNSSCGRYSSDLNCKTFTANADTCVDCPDYYKLDSNNKCQEVMNCQTFNENKMDCTLCKDGFYLPVSGVCTARTAENCTATFDDRDQCSACAINFWLDASDNNLCKSITPVQFCNTYKTNANECSVCVSEKYLSNPTTCSSIINEVEKCNFYEGNGQCKTCEDGYYLNNNTCTLGTITGCKVYELQTKCAECSSNYFLNSTNQCTGYSSDLNCLTFNTSKDECTTCGPYNTLDSNNKCVAIVGCKEWGTNLKICSVCEPTYYLNSFTNLCVLRTRTNCATTQPNKDECATCANEFYMDYNDDNICKAVTTVAKCGSYSPDSNTCQSCSGNSYLNQNTCTDVTTTINNCKIYQSATVCQTCDDGHLLSGGSCVTGNVSNCKTYVTADQCYECLPNFYVTGTFKCSAYTANLNCKTFDPRGDKCIDCPTDYSLVNSVSCKRLEGCSELETNNTDCKTCKEAFLLDSTTKECIPRLASNCETYNETEDKCSTCATGFYFDSTTETCKNRTVYKSCQGYEETEDKCTVCTSGFYLINGSCKSLNNPIAKCAEYSADGICQTCETSFNLKSGNTECVKKLENCTTTNDNGECTQCNTGYYLKDPKQCLIYSFHPNCTTLDPKADKCTECTDFHKLNDSNVCVELSRCQVFESDNKTCQTCKLAYALNKTTKECESERPERCHIWDPAQGVCEECHSPYKLDDNECVEDKMSVGMILLIFFLVLFILLCIILLILLCLRCCMKKEAAAYNEDASIDTFQSPNIEYKDPTQSSEMVPTPAPIIPLDPTKPGPLTSEIKKKQFSYNPRVFDEESGGFRSNEYGTTQSKEFGTDDKFKILSTQGDSKRGVFDTGRTGDDITKSNNIIKSDLTSRDQNSWRIPEEDEKQGNNTRF